MSRRTFATLAILFPLCVLSGCLNLGEGTQPAQYYQLLPTGSSVSEVSFSLPDDVAIQVGPLDLATYLDRPQIVTRADDNRLELAEFDRWAEPLESNLMRVLSENLAKFLLTDQIAIYPWRGSSPRLLQVKIEILRLDGGLDDQVTLDVRWVVVDQDRKGVLPITRATYQTDVTGDNYRDLVVAYNELINQFSRNLAEQLRTVSF